MAWNLESRHRQYFQDVDLKIIYKKLEREGRMKKTFLKGALAALVGVGLMAGSAMAASYEFVDMIDTWGGFESALITENSPLSYIHDLTDDVDFGAGDLVTSATLELDFTNDYYDGAI